MIKNNGYTTFLLSSIIAITLLGVSYTGVQTAFAHKDPDGCTINGASTTVTLLRNGLPAGSSVINGETIEMQITIDKGGGADHCAVDGSNGVETGLGTNATLPDNTLLQLDFGCVGGTSNVNDNIGPADCAGSPTTKSFIGLNYTVDCADVKPVGGGVFRLIWLQNTKAWYHDFDDDEGPSVLTKSDTIQKACTLPQYSANTTSSDTGLIDGTVSDPTDTVHIFGVDGVQGNWTTDAILSGPSGDYDATCVTSPLVSSGAFPVDVTCTLDLAPIDLTDPGTYCWDVNVTETTDAYSSGSDGTFLGAEDSEDECFSIEEQYTVLTTSSDTGVESDGSINDVTDTVHITGVNGVEGNWTTDAVLSGPGGPYDATCVTSPLVTDGTFPVDVVCSLDGNPFPLETPGQYCWDVTINETTIAYGTSGDGEYLGSDDAENECFTIPEEYTVSTLSSDTGETETTVSDPTDTVTITGANGVEGNFETNAVLSGPGGPYDATCVTSPLTTDAFPVDVTCSLDLAPIELTESGQYCWDVNVTETTEAYGFNSDGTFYGIDDADNECFTIANFEGHTPGFYKNNWDRFCDQSDPGPAPFGDCSWVLERGDDDFSDAFGIAEIELRANGKNTYPDPTLREALDANGGGVNALARSCVAAKLNAEHPEINYPIDADTVIAECKAAYDSGNASEINSLHSQLDAWNNLGDTGVSQQWPN